MEVAKTVEINFNNLEDDDENEKESEKTKELKTDLIFSNIQVNNFIKIYKNSLNNNLYLFSKYNVTSPIIVLPPEII